MTVAGIQTHSAAWMGTRGDLETPAGGLRELTVAAAGAACAPAGSGEDALGAVVSVAAGSVAFAASSNVHYAH